jgi:hypothetical protein
MRMVKSRTDEMRGAYSTHEDSSEMHTGFFLGGGGNMKERTAWKTVLDGMIMLNIDLK